EEAVEEIQESISSSRRDLFPDLAGGVVLNIDEDPLADGEGDREGSDEAADSESPVKTDEAVGVSE
ncbi:metallophosphoesterase, partial [Halorubrum sp. Atlit-26R]